MKQVFGSVAACAAPGPTRLATAANAPVITTPRILVRSLTFPSLHWAAVGWRPTRMAFQRVPRDGTGCPVLPRRADEGWHFPPASRMLEGIRPGGQCDGRMEGQWFLRMPAGGPRVTGHRPSSKR